MSKVKLTKKGKGIILAVIASILLILLIVLLLNIKTPKTYDISKLNNLLINEYQSLYLNEMDHIDVLNEFGFEKSEVEDALYLKSLEIDKDGNDITKERNLIIIMNTEKYEEYYGIFESHITSNKMYTEDKGGREGEKEKGADKNPRERCLGLDLEKWGVMGMHSLFLYLCIFISEKREGFFIFLFFLIV